MTALHPDLKQFAESLKALPKAIRTARRQRRKLTSASSAAESVRTQLANLRRSFIKLKETFPSHGNAAVATQLGQIDPLVTELLSCYPNAPEEILRLCTEIDFKIRSDLAAAMELAEEAPGESSSRFVPNELIEARHHQMSKILWEANECFHRNCFNASAAMFRKLIENLIIQAYEKKGEGAKIKQDGNYLELSNLIGQATSGSVIKLTQNTRRILPDLKFFGDMAAHNPNALVRKDDLVHRHHAIRSAIEELANYL